MFQGDEVNLTRCLKNGIVQMWDSMVVGAATGWLFQLRPTNTPLDLYIWWLWKSKFPTPAQHEHRGMQPLGNSINMVKWNWPATTLRCDFPPKNFKSLSSISKGCTHACVWKRHSSDQSLCLCGNCRCLLRVWIPFLVFEDSFSSNLSPYYHIQSGLSPRSRMPVTFRILRWFRLQFAVYFV